MKLAEDPHRRLNPLTNEWVLVSPHRTARPWLGETHSGPASKPVRYDSNCYLCPGNMRAGGVRNPTYGSTFAFDNDYAALKSDTPVERSDQERAGLLVAEGESGICRVICFSPRHDLTLSTMKVEEIDNVVRMWAAQHDELGTTPSINYVQIFENRGAMMGASNPHPHCQVWATHSIPDIVAKESAAQTKYLQEHSRCLLCEYSALEEKQKVRVVCANEGFLVIVPFWAVWPFEVLLVSRRHFNSFAQFGQKDTRFLSEILKQLTATYDRVFDVPFPYSMGFHQAPTDEQRHPAWHFHAHFYPPLLRSATVRKYMVGFEMLGMPQRDITPEEAAAKLRSLAV